MKFSSDTRGSRLSFVLAQTCEHYTDTGCLTFFSVTHNGIKWQRSKAGCFCWQRNALNVNLCRFQRGNYTRSRKPL